MGQSSNCIHGFLRCPSVALLCCLFQGGLHLRCLCDSLSLSLPLAQMRLTGDAFESRSRSTSNNVNGYDLTIAIVVAIQESPMDQSSWLQRSSSFSCRFQASQSCLVFCLLLGRSAQTSGCKDWQIGSKWASLSMKRFYPAFESCS